MDESLRIERAEGREKMTENQTWEGWETVQQIGVGGFATVYEIQRRLFDSTEKAALKVITIPKDEADIEELRAEGLTDNQIQERLESVLKDIVKEYSLMAELKGNTNIVYCDDIKIIPHKRDIGWDILIKMELLTPLTKLLDREIPPGAVVQLGKDICNALMFCENRNIIHRDIKPQNILVSKDGVCKLADFGIAKVAETTHRGTRIGTMKYMAPEIFNGKPYGRTVDIYSLGIVMYWMLNDRRFPFAPPPTVQSARMDEESNLRRLAGESLPPPAHGSRQLQNIVLRACAFDPRQRFQSAEEMFQALLLVSDESFDKSNNFAPGIVKSYGNSKKSKNREKERKNASFTVIVMIGIVIASILITVGILILLPAITGNKAANGSSDPVLQDHMIAEGTCGTCSWTIDEDGLLMISPSNGNSGRLDSFSSQSGSLDAALDNAPWSSYADKITEVIVDPGVEAGEECVCLFAGLSNCSKMDLSHLNTEQVMSMKGMFYKCSSLLTLDLSGFNTSNVTDMSYMFLSCRTLRTLDISGFDTSPVALMTGMFVNCVGLKTVYLGSYFSFHGKTISNTTDMARFPGTDNWSRDDGKYGPYSSEQLRDNYIGTIMSGKWVRTK